MNNYFNNIQAVYIVDKNDNVKFEKLCLRNDYVNDKQQAKKSQKYNLNLLMFLWTIGQIWVQQFLVHVTNSTDPNVLNSFFDDNYTEWLKNGRKDRGTRIDFVNNRIMYTSPSFVVDQLQCAVLWSERVSGTETVSTKWFIYFFDRIIFQTIHKPLNGEKVFDTNVVMFIRG